MTDIIEAVLPLSGHIFQWRDSDAHWRWLRDRDDAADVEWAPCTGDTNITIEADGDVWNHPSWLVASGELPECGRVEVMRTDDSIVPLVTAGRIWAAEWIGHGEPVTVQYGDDFPYTVRLDRPTYLP